MITYLTKQTMQVEVEKLILLKEAQKGMSYLLTVTPYEF